MSDGYFHILLTKKKESNSNVFEISIDPSSELIISVPNTNKQNRLHQQYAQFRSFYRVCESRARLDILA